jgi:hypothetical protein
VTIWIGFALLVLIIILIIVKKLALALQAKTIAKGLQMKNNPQSNLYSISIMETIHAVGASILASILLA